ncbi:unnamed protein product [Rotaria sordida]|uniref:Uncharacterized protein n=1 Tax=Rotaria sordida TaxID=392033 RepID=A0A814Q1X7_9BILA|nr:unnamed protein product [Rotaria sordida]
MIKQLETSKQTIKDLDALRQAETFINSLKTFCNQLEKDTALPNAKQMSKMKIQDDYRPASINQSIGFGGASARHKPMNVQVHKDDDDNETNENNDQRPRNQRCRRKPTHDQWPDSAANQIDLPSNEDIKHSFKDFSNNKIISCVNYFFEAKYGQCHIYSCPYPIPTYENISNNFPSGLFRYVSDVSLFDEHPFEYEFFIQIAQSFPFLKNLTITNQKGQNNKQYRKSNNNNEDLLIRYPYLKYLDFKQTHNDYIEQFLLDTKTCLPYDIVLFTDFKSLQRVTHNFTRNATRVNCSKMRYICLDRISRFPKHFKNYFLDTEIHVV